MLLSKVPVGHNTVQTQWNGFVALLVSLGTLQIIYFELAATQLFKAGVDEQLIRSKTGHRSCNGVWSYKRQTEQLTWVTSNILNAFKGRTCSQDSNTVLANNTQVPSTCYAMDKDDKGKEHQIPLQLPNITINGSSHVTFPFGQTYM